MTLTASWLGRLPLLAALAFAGSSAAADGPPDLRHLQGLGDVRYHRHESALLERGFHLFVRLPESYGERETERYPTVYLLDGGVTFPLLAAYYRYLSLGEEVPEMIVVGITYGSTDWRAGNLRGTDFTAPSAEREHYGGAARFQEMLRTELLPRVERDYRSDPARRLIFGQSLGGQFVLFTALTDPGLFWGHIASNPALHRNLDFFLREHTAGDGGDAAPSVGGEASGEESSGAALPRPRVFVSSGELDDERFRRPALRWIERWREMPPTGWSLRAVTLEGHGHFSPAPEAFRQGVRWVFEPE